jgi:hypothetical protein
MEITMRSLWTVVHGMGFGALYLLACTGALFELYRLTSGATPYPATVGQERFLKFYLGGMAVVAWISVLTGAYMIYPWYRATLPPGATDLSLYPQRLLMANPTTIGWHSLGMEWKEHVAWFAPISITMVAFVFAKYGRQLAEHRQLRSAVLVFAAASFLAAGIAGFFGAMINKYAPVHGGENIQILQGGER